MSDDEELLKELRENPHVKAARERAERVMGKEMADKLTQDAGRRALEYRAKYGSEHDLLPTPATLVLMARMAVVLVPLLLLLVGYNLYEMKGFTSLSQFSDWILSCLKDRCR